jgi:hypothetical protein
MFSSLQVKDGDHLVSAPRIQKIMRGAKECAGNVWNRHRHGAPP